MKLGTSGASLRTDLLDAREARNAAQTVESLEYSAMWLTDAMGRDPRAVLAGASSTSAPSSSGWCHTHG